MDYIEEIAKTRLPFPPVELPLVKRMFDIAGVLFLCLLFSPFILIIILIFVIEYIFCPDSRGPLFYSETRISKGLPFKLYKFRIFKTVSSRKYFQEHGFIQTKALEQDKNNLTFLGAVLKQIYMDELPQLYNVLKGEMTLVGPRPSNEVVTWEDGKNGKFQRYLFKCGLTGRFQAEKGGKLQKDQTESDMEYILFCKNSPGWKIIFNDIKILCETVLTVLRAKGV
jgi:lipopolysaccharide/colanic/teichoic acid biosynthesis glycosyltransferase